MLQIVASDVGATITGVDESNTHQFLYELCWTAARGQLQPNKFVVAVRAAGIAADTQTLDAWLVDILW